MFISQVYEKSHRISKSDKINTHFSHKFTHMSTTPGQRLKEFFESTHLSVRDFAKEIGSESKYRTLYAVFNGEREPSPKLVRSIIQRFPALSFDWVFVGAGTMILEQSANMISKNDYDLGVTSRVQQAMDRLDKVEFALNELANQITRAMAHQAEMTNVFFKRIDEMTEVSRDQQAEMKANRERANELVDAIIKTNTETVESVEKMINRSKNAQAIVDERQQNMIEEFKAYKKVVDENQKIGKNAVNMGMAVAKEINNLIKKVEENNKLQNKWEGHLESLTGAAELINKMGGFSMSQKPSKPVT